MTAVEPVSTEIVRVPVSDGTAMQLHVARPASANGGAMLVFQEAFGVNEWLRSVLARCAGLGLLAVAPELYHRSGDGIVGAYDAGHEVIAPYTKATTVDGLVADVRAAHEWIVTANAGVDAGRVAALGFCMGGRVAFLANAHVRLAAAISLYGGNIPRWFEFVERQQAPLLMFWGERDETIPRQQARLVADRLTEAGLRHTQVTFSHAGHAFFRDTRSDVYDATASRAAWALTLEQLRETGVLAGA